MRKTSAEKQQRKDENRRQSLSGPEKTVLRAAAVGEFSEQVRKDCFGAQVGRFGQIVQSLCLVDVTCQCTVDNHSRITTGPPALNIRYVAGSVNSFFMTFVIFSNNYCLNFCSGSVDEARTYIEQRFHTSTENNVGYVPGELCNRKSCQGDMIQHSVRFANDTAPTILAFDFEVNRQMVEQGNELTMDAQSWPVHGNINRVPRTLTLLGAKYVYILICCIII